MTGAGSNTGCRAGCTRLSRSSAAGCTSLGRAGVTGSSKTSLYGRRRGVELGVTQLSVVRVLERQLVLGNERV